MNNSPNEKTYPLEESRINWIKSQLRQYAKLGRPKYYQVEVDGFTVIEKTEDAEEFDMLNAALNDDTEEVTIKIFNGLSNRNTRFRFVANGLRDTLDDMDQLSGFNLGSQKAAEHEAKQSEAVARERERWEREQLEQEIQQVKGKLAEAEEYIGMLEDELESKGKFPTSEDLNIGNIASGFLEGIIRRNPEIIKGIPGGEELAGIFSRNKGQQTEQRRDTEASFSAQSDEYDSAVNADYAAFGRRLEELFTEQELEQIIGIINALSDDKSLIADVSELLENQQ